MVMSQLSESLLPAEELSSTLAASVVPECLDALALHWPEVAARILDSCLFFEGHGPKDPQLAASVSLGPLLNPARPKVTCLAVANRH